VPDHRRVPASPLKSKNARFPIEESKAVTYYSVKSIRRTASQGAQRTSTPHCLQEINLTEKNKHWLRVKGWKKVFQANGPHKQARVDILISDKVDFRLKSIRRDNESRT
jgi:hypothetical protein